MSTSPYGRVDLPPTVLAYLAPWIALLVIAVVAALDSYFTVGPQQMAVVLRFGKRHAIVGPGLHAKLPVADDVVVVDMAEQRFRLPYERGPTGQLAQRGRRQSDDDLRLMLTGDLNAVAVEWTVQWRVHDPYKYLVALRKSDVNRTIYAAAFSVMNRLIGDYSFDEVLTEKREEVGERARVETQQLLDRYELGVRITGLQLQRITPPESVRSAFDAVIAAIQERQQREHEAERERNTLIPQAIARADQYRREAEGYAARLKAEAQGETARLLARYRAYKEAPQETRERLYLDTMEKVLQNAGGIWIVDENLPSVIPFMRLDEAR